MDSAWHNQLLRANSLILRNDQRYLDFWGRSAATFQSELSLYLARQLGEQLVEFCLELSPDQQKSSLHEILLQHLIVHFLELLMQLVGLLVDFVVDLILKHLGDGEIQLGQLGRVQVELLVLIQQLFDLRLHPVILNCQEEVVVLPLLHSVLKMTELGKLFFELLSDFLVVLTNTLDKKSPSFLPQPEVILLESFEVRIDQSLPLLYEISEVLQLLLGFLLEMGDHV